MTDRVDPLLRHSVTPDMLTQERLAQLWADVHATLDRSDEILKDMRRRASGEPTRNDRLEKP